jgi:hypothetical protein
MVLFIFAIIVAVIGAVLVLVARPATTSAGARAGMRAGGAAAVLLGIICFFLATTTTVGPSDVGIETAFGHVDGDLTPGIHLVAPWESVTVWDDSVQQTQFDSAKGSSGCLRIRIAGQQSACLDVNIFWRDNPAGSDAQFREYRTFPRVAGAFMSRAVVTRYFNSVFEKFDPVQQVASGTTSGTTVSTLAAQVLTDMRTAYAGTIFIQSLSAGQIQYDSYVESALSSVIKAKANTAVAQQNEQTAHDQATANAELEKKLNAAVIEQDCLNMTQQQLQAGNTLPQGWNCTGSSAVGILAGH